MDIKELVNWCWQRKWWFVISVVLCLGIGTFYFLSATPKHNVSASIMLRTPDLDSQQGEMMSMMGVEGNKSAEDEIEVLLSRDLMAQIVDSLHLTVVVEKRHHLRWMPVYPCPEFALAYEQLVIKKHTYRVKEGGDKYRITVYPRLAMIDILQERLDVKRIARESQIISLSTVTTSPNQAIDILNMLLNLYNEGVGVDKYNIALQLQTFVNDRLITLKQDLLEAETALEAYKIEHQITNITGTAAEYHSLIKSYDHQLEDINYELRLLDNLDEQLKDTLVRSNKGLIYGTCNSSAVNTLISAYNEHVSQRIALMEAATENNPRVKTLDYLLEQQRLNITRGCKEARASLQLRKEHLMGLSNTYSKSLAELPEIERTYIELQRAKDTKEQQYLYLIQKREESDLILASSTVPVKVVSSAQKAAKLVSPSIMKTGVGSMLLGLLLPLLVYFFGVFKKEFF